MRSILRLKRVYAEKYGSIRGYKAGWAKSGIAPLPDLRFDVLRTRGRWAADPGNSYRNALRFLRFPISVMLYAPHSGRMTTIPKTCLRGLSPQTSFSALRRFKEGVEESGDASLPDSCFYALRA